MGTVRFVFSLVLSGLILLAGGVVFSLLPANAATERDRETSAYRYTDHAQRASTGRTLPIYIDRDFDEYERERIVLAIKQWNHVLNGFVQLRPGLLPPDASSATIAQVRRSGGWVVARVDSRHLVARQGGAQQALALTVGNSGGGSVYVISDRFNIRDLTGVMLHELGHVLGAGHSHGGGLMAPVYEAASGRCIDRGAVAMVAQAQRLPLNQLNWCVGPGQGDGREAASGRPSWR